MDDFEYLQTLGVPHGVKTADTLADIQEAASNTNTEPTEQQKETGRYKKGRQIGMVCSLSLRTQRGLCVLVKVKTARRGLPR